MTHFFLPTESATITAAEKIAHQIKAPAVIFLHGELGAGKTTFVRGLLRAWGYAGLVKSPSYTLVESYSLNDIMVHHFDLYRLTSPDELYEIGFNDYLTPNAILFIEWPEKGGNLLPKAQLICQFEIKGNGRELSIAHAHS